MSDSRTDTYLNWQTSRPPLGESFAQPARVSSIRSENLDSTIRVHTVGSPTVRDVLFPFRNLTQSSLKVVDRHRKCARNVTGCVLVRRPRIEHDDTLRSSAFQELVHLHGLGVGSIAEMFPDQTFQIGELMFGDGSDCRTQAEDGG